MAKQTSNGIDINRRKFITVILIGGGAFIVEKILTPLLSKFVNNKPIAKAGSSNRAVFSGFQIVENKKRLSIYDNSGEEIFQIDKEA